MDRLGIGHALVIFFAAAVASAAQPFAIEVLDDQTDRGVPMVELQTTNSARYYTDSNGLIAFDEPDLMNQKVFFAVASHGYEFPKDGFGIRGVVLETKPGGSANLKIKRINIAERRYRLTGSGIYRDTVLLGRTAPIKEPLLNAQITGQDGILNALYRGKLYWFWGDTLKLSYPLGNFAMCGATTPFLDRDGGRIIYLEGSYVNTFSGNKHPTPFYEYNQIMYRLDLSDPRLKF
jgi:hypothetical protein